MPVLGGSIIDSAKKDPLMSAGNWMIGAGAVVMFLGLCFLPAAMADQSDPALLAAGFCTFSVGSLLVAAGMYLKARMLQAGITPAHEPTGTKKVRGGCDLCKGDLPVIQCRVHQLHLCANCLGEHYDYRSCAYSPSTRRVAGKGVAKAHGA